MQNFLNTGIDLKVFSPTQPIGIFILIIGLIFSGMIFYIIYAVSTNKESLEDVKIRNERKSIQQEKIGKLFPKIILNSFVLNIVKPNAINTFSKSRE